MEYKFSILYKKYPFLGLFHLKIANKKMFNRKEKTLNLDTNFSEFELFVFTRKMTFYQETGAKSCVTFFI